jgi:hypothetical protein
MSECDREQGILNVGQRLFDHPMPRSARKSQQLMRDADVNRRAERLTAVLIHICVTPTNLNRVGVVFVGKKVAHTFEP